MSELSDVLGALMVSLVHAQRIADEETAAVAEYYKDHPLLEGLSLPRIRVPELTIDMPITIDEHKEATNAEMESPTEIHRALNAQLKQTLDDENVLSKTQTFMSNFDKEAIRALKEVAEKDRQGVVKFSREMVVRSLDQALQTALKKSNADKELTADQKNRIRSQMRHRVSDVSLKSVSMPSSLTTTVTSDAVKENANAISSTRLKITLREEGLEWTQDTEKSRLQSE